MQLKLRTPCCRQPALAWNNKTWRFECRCGKFMADTSGRQIDLTSPTGLKRGRPKKRSAGSRMLARDNGTVNDRPSGYWNF